MGGGSGVTEDSWRRLSQFKRLATSQGIEEPDWGILRTQVNSDLEFRRLVSELYMIWREQWGADVSFLQGKERSTYRIRDFGKLINCARTAHQHSTSKSATHELEQWLQSVCGGGLPANSGEWAACARELTGKFDLAVSELANVAALVYRSPALRSSWHSRAAQSVESMLDLVAADLGLNFSQKDYQYHKRQIEGRWKARPPRPNQDQRLALIAMVEQQLIARVESLPCSYSEVLERLKIVGMPEAVPALQLAHAISAISGRRGVEFVDSVAEIWISLRP